jgi:cytochrome P450
MSNLCIPPGPRGHALFGCLRQYARDPLGFYERAAREYGGVVRIRALPGFHWVIVSDPEAVEHVLHANQKNYRKPALFTRTMGRLAGLGLLTSDGETWRRNRKLMQPAFHRRRIATMVSVMAEAVEQTAGRLAEAARAGRPVDMLAEMTRLTLGVASRTLFGIDVSGECDEIGGPSAWCWRTWATRGMPSSRSPTGCPPPGISGSSGRGRGSTPWSTD